MNYEAIHQQLLRLLVLMSQPGTDVIWSSYKSSDEAIEELDRLISCVENKDSSAIERIRILALPTCDWQEISISSGWGNEFLEISEILDRAMNIEV